MVKSLVITDNINFIQALANRIHEDDLSIQLSLFAKCKLETLQFLQNLDNLNIGIIFLDKSIEKSYDRNFFEKYKNIIIKISIQTRSYLFTHKNLVDLDRIIKQNDIDERKFKIINELKYIGYRFNYKGTHYLVDTILEMFIQQHHMIDNLQSNIYPIIAKKYNKTIYNVKSSINKATDCMYTECDASKLVNYFHFCYDTKPTIKQVVFEVINRVS